MARVIFGIRKSEAVSFVKKIKEDKKVRERTILYASTAVNYFFVIFQLYGGIRYGSAWFTALGVYYAALTSVTLYLGLSRGKDSHEKWKVFRASGWALIVANLALVVMVFTMIAAPGITIRGYSTVIAVAVTIWTFYLLISAVVGIAKNWKKQDAVAIAENSVRLISAVVSVLMLQTAMIASYGAQVIEETQKTLTEIEELAGVPTDMNYITNDMIQTFVASNRVTGVLVIVLVLGITIYMIVKGSKEYKKSK